MGMVTWGKKAPVKFESAGLLSQCQPQVVPAVYAITYKQDPASRPKSHTVVYFGAADNMAQQASVIHKDIQHWWDNHGGNKGDLFIFIHPMPGSSQYERANVQHQLVCEYDPLANN